MWCHRGGYCGHDKSPKHPFAAGVDCVQGNRLHDATRHAGDVFCMTGKLIFEEGELIFDESELLSLCTELRKELFVGIALMDAVVIAAHCRLAGTQVANSRRLSKSAALNANWQGPTHV